MLLAGFAWSCASSVAAMPPEVAEALKGVQAYETGTSLKPVKALEAYAIRIAADPAGRAELAAALAAALDAPGTKPDAVAYLCRELGRVGGAAEVPALARRLADERHSDAARLALEMIPDPAAGAALREALGRLSGRARNGVMNSLAARADDAAVPALKALAKDADAATARAAAGALGRLGTKAAAEALAGMPGDVANRARLECSLRLAARGDPARPWTSPSDLPQGRDGAARVAMLSTLARVDPEAALQSLLRAAAGPEDFVAESAIGILSQMSGTAGAGAMTGALASLPPRRKALMLDALALRGDAAALPAVRPLLRDTDGEVREAAARAIGAFGTAEDVACLAASATGGSAAAAEALAAMKDAGADAAILKQIPGGEPATKAVLIEAALARRAGGAEQPIATALTDANEAVQVAAARALAVIGTPSSVPMLLGVLGRPASPKAGREIETALGRIGRRAADPAAVSKTMVETLRGKEATDEQSAALLRTLAGLGGPAALEAVRARTSAGAPSVRDAAVRALADWPDAEPIGDLHALASGASDARHRAIALRGLLRLAPGAADPLDWLKKAQPLAADPESRRALLSALGAVPGPGSLAMAVDLAKDPAVAVEAALAAVAAGKPLAASEPAAVEKAMLDLLALKIGPPAEPQMRALLREARGEGAGGGGLKAEERAARVAAIAKGLPQGARLAVYLDCGPERQATNGAAGLRVLGGRSYAWDGAAAIDAPNATVAFSEAEVALEVSGLDAKRSYRVGLSWWDFDGNGRAQSVWVGRDRAVDKTGLPSGRAGKGPSRVEFALPGAAGSLRISVRREGDSNVVLGEAWLIDAGPVVAASPSSSAPPPGAALGPRKRILLATGLEYPGHKWRETAPLVKRAIEADPRLAVEVSEDPAAWGASELRKNDAIVLHYMNWEDPGPGEAAQENLRAAVSNGTGLVLVHFACGAFQGWPEFAKIAGRAWNPKLRGHDPRGRFRVEIADRAHPVTAGMAPFETEDELYTCLDGDAPIRVLASARSKVDGRDYPMAFVLEYGRGRVFHCVLGHDVKAFEAGSVGELFRRGTAWAAGLEPE